MYRKELWELVSQGDIFDDVPIAYVQYAGDPRNPVTQVFTVRVKAIVLSHDCEYDKPKNPYVIVAEVRPLSEVPESSQGNIRHYKTLNTFYLEPIPDKLEESYVDFRRIERVYKPVLEHLASSGKRIASLTDEARLALQRQIALFFGHGRGRQPP